MIRARVLGSFLVVSALVGGTTACATPGPYRYPVAVRQIDQRAYDRGFSDGRRLGATDASRRRPFDYARHNEYRNDAGYRGRDRELYRQGFVAGYQTGYGRQAPVNQRGPYYGDGSFGRSGGGRYVSPARDVGYRDGFDQGRDDRRDSDRYDPVRASRYRSGDHDYNGRYGSRDDYKREYRAAFVQGYEAGYRGN